MIPTVHLNGTSREELCLLLDKANIALLAAYVAVSATAPHGRDYYPQGEEAFVKATAEHRSRLRRIREVQDEIVAIWNGVYDQTKKTGL
jgi:hypothetical protein